MSSADCAPKNPLFLKFPELSAYVVQGPVHLGLLDVVQYNLTHTTQTQ
jgi:hypothetical protein